MRRLSHSSVFKANFAIDERPKYPIHPYMYALSFLRKASRLLPSTPRSQFLELTQAFVTGLLVRPISHDRHTVSLSLNPESKTKEFDVGEPIERTFVLSTLIFRNSFPSMKGLIFSSA